MGDMTEFDAVFCDKLDRLLAMPDFECSPRGNLVKECLGVTFRLKDPRSRLLTLPARKADYGFAVGEFLWYWNGRRDLKTMLYYNKRMADFSDDGKNLNSAYGYRLRRKLTLSQEGLFGGTQWETAISTLTKDTDSRRAVLLINSPEDQYVADTRGSKDVPCTLSLQFFIRDNALYLHVVMRSNDIWWGLSYDLFSFTLLQECMLQDLKVTDPTRFGELRLGEYIHTAGSLHLYERHFDVARLALEQFVDRTSKRLDVGFVPGMLPLDIDHLEGLLVEEERLRLDPAYRIDPSSYDGSAAAWMAVQLNSHREKRNREAERGNV